jgi:hypothetical protein
MDWMKNILTGIGQGRAGAFLGASVLVLEALTLGITHARKQPHIHADLASWG